jgi:hypothetical protein
MANYYDSKQNNNLNTQRASGMPDIGNAGGKLAVTSTNIEVFSNDMRVGFVQSLTPSESRQIQKIQELGSEGVIQSVPSNTKGGQLSVTRFALYNSSIFNALGLTKTANFVNSKGGDYINNNASTMTDDYRTYGNPFKTLKDQRVPLEFKVKTKTPAGAQYYIDTYVDCWITSYTKAVTSSAITITETATLQYSAVYSEFV